MDANLYELLHSNQFTGLQQEVVRVLAIQMLNSLNFLSKMNIIHCDIKPQNFVICHWGKSGIKLIDFGTSCFENQQIYTYIQSRYYRAPEIIIPKGHYTTAIDMWSFGCLVAELIIGRPLFPGNSDIEQVLYMVAVMGYPGGGWGDEVEVIRQGEYLEREGGIEGFEREFGVRVQRECLRGLEERLGEGRYPLLHFLRQILRWNPEDRITPAQALQHPWVTCGFPDQIRQLYSIYESKQKQGKSIKQIDQKQKDKQKQKQKQRQKQKVTTKHKRTKSKSKSKSRQRSQDKNSSITKTKAKNFMKNTANFSINLRNQSKTLKFDLPQSLISIKSKTNKLKKNQEKSRQEKSNKSPKIVNNKFFI